VTGRAGCFGCAPANRAGLRLRFREAAGELVSAVSLGAEYESHPGVIHGGIVATVLDETMARAAQRGREGAVVTVGLRVRFLEPMRSRRRYVARASAVSQQGPSLTLRGELWGQELIAVAHGVFRVLPARRRGGVA